MIPKGVHHRLENHGEVPAVGVFHSSPLAPRPDLGHVVVEEVADTPEVRLAVGDAP
jgi:putative monooxygenase